VETDIKLISVQKYNRPIIRTNKSIASWLFIVNCWCSLYADV